MVRTWIPAAFLVAVAFLGGISQADEWTVTALAGTETGVARVGWRPGGSNVAIFGQAVWITDVKEPKTEALGGHIGAAYDLVKDDPLTILKWTVPVTWYAGAMAGAVKPEDTGWQTSPIVLTGLSFGGKRVRVVLEGWYLPGSSITEAFANINDKGRLLVGAELRF